MRCKRQRARVVEHTPHGDHEIPKRRVVICIYATYEHQLCDLNMSLLRASTIAYPRGKPQYSRSAQRHTFVIDWVSLSSVNSSCAHAVMQILRLVVRSYPLDWNAWTYHSGICAESGRTIARTHLGVAGMCHNLNVGSSSHVCHRGTGA